LTGDLVAARVTVTEFGLGQPRLDEVFLALTGHPARTHDDEESAA
jgi:ABC-2 type transport system ATP-binding protein